jgi:hypothetical protein
MTSKNDITGDLIKSKSPSKKYYDNYDKIFRKDKPNENSINDPPSSADNESSRRKD